MPKWTRWVVGSVPGLGWVAIAVALNVKHRDPASRLAEWAAQVGIAHWPPWLTDERAVAALGIVVCAFYVWFLRPARGHIPKIISVELDKAEIPKWFYLRVTVVVLDEPCTFGTDWVADVIKPDKSRVTGIHGVSHVITSAAHSRDRFEVRFPYDERIPNRGSLRGARFTIRGADGRGRGLGFP